MKEQVRSFILCLCPSMNRMAPCGLSRSIPGHEVDDEWFEHAPEISVHGQTLLVAPAEELLWCKLYVLQRDRCDWPPFTSVPKTAGEADSRVAR